MLLYSGQKGATLNELQAKPIWTTDNIGLAKDMFLGKSDNSQMFIGYIKSDNPLIVDGKGANWHSIENPFAKGRRTARVKTDDIVKEAWNKGYDAVIFKNIAEAKNMMFKIKSNVVVPKNAQTQTIFEEDLEYTFAQSAYAGSRVDYDRPSLEAIGTGEGAQVHGWGLYYALDKDIAERYREMFTGDAALKYDEEKLLRLYEKYERAGEYDKAELIGSVLLRHDERDFDSMLADEIITQDTIKWFDGIKDNYLNKERKLGQVHEVDIPEIDVLLDEQKTFDEQSEFVKEKLIYDVYPDVFGKDVLKDVRKAYKNPQAETLIKNIINAELSQNEQDINKSWADWSNFEKQNEHTEFDPNDVYDVISFFKQESNEDLLGTLDSGNAIYKNISDKLGSDKEASLLLEKHGIKGITYWGAEDGRCFVIFSDKDVKVLRKKFDELGNMLFQGRKTQMGQRNLAAWNPLRRSKELFTGANETSIMHELSHFWLDNMMLYSRLESAARDSGFAKVWNNIKKYLNIDDRQERINESQAEKYTSAYMQYIRTSKIAPEVDLGFKGMDEFIGDISLDYFENAKHREADGTVTSELEIITPEMVDTFQKLTTTDLNAVRDLVVSLQDREFTDSAIDSQLGEESTPEQMKTAVAKQERETRQKIAEKSTQNAERDSMPTDIPQDSKTMQNAQNRLDKEK
ncbi:MAG: hypothetical protein J6R99_04110, partial [Alphaproteobacteria bacterium]|nr:hypothetical protein [Alphaproteobacteria bacterium]